MNQEQKLREIRNRWDVDDFVTDARAQSAILTLLEAIDQRDAIIHDLQLDGSALARRAVEEFIVKAMEWGKELCKRHSRRLANLASHAGASGMIASDFPDEPSVGEMLSWLMEQLVQSGADANPLPPDQARAEAERLRAKLREIMEEMQRLEEGVRDHTFWSGDAGLVLRHLRKKISEDTL